MTEVKLMDNVFNILIVLITFALGIFATVLREWLIHRREKKRIKQLFIDFFNSLKMIEHPLKARMKSMVLLLRMGKDLILEKLGMMYNEHYESHIPLGSPVDIKIIEEDIKYLRIRLDNERWNIIMRMSKMIITDYSKKSIKENQFTFVKGIIDPKSNENTLIDFLKFLQETYKDTGIIKKSKKLIHGKLTLKIKERMKELREKKNNLPYSLFYWFFLYIDRKGYVY